MRLTTGPLLNPLYTTNSKPLHRIRRHPLAKKGVFRVTRCIGLSDIERGQSGSYISDAYLDNGIDRLWGLWKDAGGPVSSKGKAKGNMGPPSRSASAGPLGNSVPASQPLSPPRADGADNDGDVAARKIIQVLTKDEMKVWIKDHIHLGSNAKLRSKDDLLDAILQAPAAHRPSKEDVEGILQDRKAKKSAARSKARAPVSS